ncbi:hypothetical protein N9W89_11085 [Hellea sp.]|nr:hypothetical protein [Hellea sp.]
MDIYILEITHIFFILLFSVSAIAKVISFKSFRRTLDVILEKNKSVSRPIGIFIIFVEVLIVVTLVLSGQFLGPAYVLILMTLAIFTFVMTWMKASGKAMSCHCFGVEPRKSSDLDIIRNIGLIGLTIFAIFKLSGHQTFEYEVTFLLFGLALIMLIITVYLENIAEILRR